MQVSFDFYTHTYTWNYDFSTQAIVGSSLFPHKQAGLSLINTWI